MDFTNKQATEISCHELDTRLLTPATYAVIDIDGRGSKAIRLDDGDSLCNFLTNDKCAAGTGRFLEVTSCTLGTGAEQLDSVTEDVTPHAITSIRTVFAGPEMINLRSTSVAPEATLVGMINAMARRNANFITRLFCEASILSANGVNRCQTFVRILESYLGIPVSAHFDAQLADTTGTVVIGQRVRTYR